MFKICTICLLTFILSSFASADEIEPVTPVITKDTTVFTDTLLLKGTSPVTSELNNEQHLYQNPTGALFKSMVIPGWGQMGNKRYIKAAIFASLDVWMISKALDYKKKASDLKSQFESATDVTIRNNYYDLYQDERSNRNKYTWYAVIISFFSMFDAYVDAHLSGHPKEQIQKDFSIDVLTDDNSGALLTLSYSF